MHIHGLYLAGVALWLVSLVVSGSCGQFIHPVALPVLAALHILQNRVPAMARDDRDARRSAYMLFVLSSAIFAAAVRSWTVGPVLIALGYACHHTVLLTNGLATPAGRTNDSVVHSVIGPATRLRWLCDIFPSRGGIAWFSPGDILVIVGTWVFAAELTVTGIIMRYFA